MLNFYIENEGSILGILAVLAIVLSSLKLIPYLKEKNIINQQNLEMTAQMTAIAKVLLSTVKLDENVKDQAGHILEICSKLISFVGSIYDAKSDDELSIAMKNAMHNAFVQLGVQVNKDVQDVIDLGIAYAINKSKAQ